MYEIFERLCKEKGVTAYKVAKATGISTATLSNWKAGRSTPKADKLQLIADYFDVPLEVFTNAIKPKTLVGKIPHIPLWEAIGGEEIKRKAQQLASQEPQFVSGYPVYYTSSETARQAQEMFEDSDMRALFHMKRGMEPEKFAAHMKMMKELYRLEHPEEFQEDNE